MTLTRSAIVILCLLAVVALALFSDRAGVAARRGDLHRAEQARFAKLATVGVLERLQNVASASPRFGTRVIAVDAKTGNQLTTDEVAQRLAAAKQ